MTQIDVHLTGPKAEIQWLLDKLKSDSDFESIINEELKAVKGNLRNPRPHGQVELYEVIVHFIVAATAHLTIELLLEKIRSYKKKEAANVVEKPVSNTRKPKV